MFGSQLIWTTFGGFAALASAFTWALGSILFRKLEDKVSPAGMNLAKCIIGTCYIGIILLLVGVKPVNNKEFLLLLASGLLGIALGDTFFFKSLMYLGPKLTVLLGTLGPVVTVILAVVFLQEKISPLAGLGILLVLVGITWVLLVRSPQGEERRKNRAAGIKFLLLSVLCTAVGTIFAKVGVASTSAMQGLFIRFLGAAAGLALYGCTNRQIKNWLVPFKELHLLKFILFTVFIVVFGGFWLSLWALKYIAASIATILNSTEPLFVLPLEAVILKTKVTLREIIAAIVAIIGVVLIFIG